MNDTGILIRRLRVKEGYPLRKVAAFLDIDQAILSKMERGQRRFTKEQVIKLADFFSYDKKEMLITFLSDRILYEIKNEDFALDALKVSEKKIESTIVPVLSRSEIIIRIKRYLANNKKIIKAWFFGSFAREEDDIRSDIDLMIEVNKNSGFSLFDLSEIQFQLEKIIPYKIDKVMKDGLNPKIKNRILSDLMLIYER